MGRVTATVLFTDLVRSTELRSRLGEESADELRRLHDQLLVHAVESHNGRVVKGLGDGIMATFVGAADAVAAGVAIQQGVERLSRSQQTPVPLAVRVGVAAGDVIFEEGDVSGTTVVEAARLCAAAGGGELLVSDVVRLLSGGGDHFAPTRLLELKGFPAPVAAAAVAWEPAPVPTVPLPGLVADVSRVFVGRDSELEQLAQMWKEAVEGERRVALVAGEPGIGKTRLASVAARRCHEAGAVVLAGRCDEDLGVPYQPFVEAVRHYVVNGGSKLRLGRHGGELVRLVPEVAEAVPALAPPLRSDPETERYRLFDAVAAWLADASAETPVVLVVDDLQWAAKPTLLLLRHVLRSPAAMSLLVVGTYRDSDVGRGHPLSAFLADLRREAGVERFPLTGLDVAGVIDYLTQAAGHELDEAGDELARAVWQETEGVPFFVGEVMRHLVESGGVEQRDGRWVVTAPLDELGIPEGVRDVVGRRLSRLSDDANRVLACASVAGLEFEPAVVQAAGGFDEDTVISALEEAVAARLVLERPGPVPENHFAHALVRATLYDELTHARRLALHRRIAEAIETLHAGALENHLPALAHHWAQVSAVAADTARAVDYATRAGDRAVAQLAHDEAVIYYRQGLDLLDVGDAPVTDSRRVELLISLGQAQLRAGDPSHRRTLLDAAYLARQADDPEALARAALANSREVAGAVAGVIDHERIELIQTALATVSENDSALRAGLLGNLAFEVEFASDRQSREGIINAAIETARRAGDLPALSRVLVATFNARAGPDTVSECLAHAEELLTVAERLGDPVIVSRACVLRGRVAMMMGELDTARRYLTRSEIIAGELGQPILRWWDAFHRTGLLVGTGHLEEGLRLNEETFALGNLSGQTEALAIFAFYQLLILRELGGDLQPVKALLEEGVARIGAVPLARAWTALCACELGKDDEARRAIANDRDFGAWPINSLWLSGVTQWAVVCHQLADTSSATRLHDLLTPYPEQLPAAGGCLMESIEHCLGMLCLTLMRPEEAAEHLAIAEQTYVRAGAPILLARARLDQARALVVRGRCADTAMAEGLVSQVVAMARNRGLKGLERRALIIQGHVS